MRNLRVIDQHYYLVPTCETHSLSIDPWSKTVAVTSKDRVIIQSGNKFLSFQIEVPGDILRCEPIEADEFFIVTTHGFHIWQNSTDQVIANFSVSNGVRCCKFSPERSLLAFVTDDFQVSLISSSFEPVASFDLKTEGFGTANPVTIGWGKKETQFHGSAGKQAAVANPEPTLSRSVYDDGRVDIAWREDGQYFAVSWLDFSAQNIRRVRVFTNSGELFSTSEPNGKMEPGLCWRPRIQLITGVQRRPMRGLDIIFFETNAERHGEFELLDDRLESQYRVEDLYFDPNGDILAVLFFSTSDNGMQDAFIRLLTCSNYQWYSKRDISFSQLSPTHPKVAFAWTCESSHGGLCSLYVTTSLPDDQKLEKDGTDFGSIVRKWSFSLSYDGSDCLTTTDVTSDYQLQTKHPGLVGVVDGGSLLLTALAHSTIPPPMFGTCLTLISPETKVEMSRGHRLISVSFPGPWVRIPPETDDVPLLLQFESNLLYVRLSCGSSEASREVFPTTAGTLEARWMCGARDAIPWPVEAISFRIDECMKVPTNPDVQNALVDASRYSACGGSELSHFCWLDCRHVVFVGCGGRLVGLLTISDDPDSVTGRWLLSLDGDVTQTENNSDTRVCGLCNTPEELLCVQLTDGRIFVFNSQLLLDSPDCTTVNFSNCSLVETDFSLSDPLYWVVRFPNMCEQLCVVRFTDNINTRMEINSCATKLAALDTTRYVLLGLHLSSHRLYAVPIPTPAERTNLPCQLGQHKSATCIMELCSSLLVLPNYILVTSMRKVLICVPTGLRTEILRNPEACVLDLLSRLDVPTEVGSGNTTGSQNWYDDFLHPIEVGAVLVRAVPDDTKVILQMPRGNLEEVHPRAVVLSYLSDLLDTTEYWLALRLMRRHRISMNLLYDHNPVDFSVNLPIMLDQVNSPYLITLFVSELIEEDVSQTMYGKFYGRGISNLVRDRVHQNQLDVFNPLDRKSKVNTICDALLEHMTDIERFLLPILTCYAKKLPSELDMGLLLLKKLHDKGEFEMWESGVRHLLYFATPLELYRVALGTYDLKLALLMAQRTQLDPKEYVAHLNEIQRITDGDESNAARAYQKFRIDDHLGRYTIALRHLHDSGPDKSEKFVEYVRLHKLYREALELFSPGSEHFQMTSCLWAEQLIAERKLSLSGEVYLRAGLFAAAARTFLSTTQPHLWAIAVTQARSSKMIADDLIELSPAEIKLQATKLAARLRDLNRHQEAMDIYLDFLEDPETAITVGLEGGLWVAARRLATLHGKLERFQRDLLTDLTEASDALLQRVLKTQDQFADLVQRLVLLRQQHREESEAKRLAQDHGNVDLMGDDETETDLYSDTSSVSDSSLSGSIGDMSLHSSGSRKSGRSAKNKRKHDAKKWSSKPGSKYEEVGLMKEISQSIELTQRLTGEISTLTLELWRVGLAENGRNLLSSINQLLTMQKRALPSVWDEWITGKVEQVDDRRFDGRRRYPFQEPFMICAPEMKTTRVTCHLLIKQEQ